MSTKRGGGRPAGKMPSPDQVARRYMQVTGDPSKIPSEAFDRQTGFSVGGRCLDRFMVKELWSVPSAIMRMAREIPVGQYNPADDRWLLAPEYVLREERRALERVARTLGTKTLQEANVQRVDRGATTVDMFHPYTQKIRARMAAMLQPLKLLERPAIRDAMELPNSPVLDIDWCTFAYPTMGTRLSRQDEVEAVGVGDTITTSFVEITTASTFTLSVAGVKVENDEAQGHSLRESRSVVLANCVTRDDAQTWVPELTVVTEEDWARLEPVVHAMEAAKKQNPDFSLMHCAVVYGNEYELARTRIVT